LFIEVDRLVDRWGAEELAVRARLKALEDAETELWLLTHPESRHLRRVAATYAHLAQTLQI